MIIEVPLFIQTNQFNCGPTALKMVLAHFGEHFGMQVLEKRIGVVKDKGVNSIQLAAAAASLGYGVVFYSISLGFNEENNELDFYKKYNDLNSGQIDVWVQKARASGAILEEREIELDDILKYISEDSIPIILLDWNVINEREEDGYQGHFSPVVGYDSKYVYVHNGGYNDHKANVSIEREIFDKARKAKGTDQDIMVVFRKGVEVKVVSKAKKKIEKKSEDAENSDESNANIGNRILKEKATMEKKNDNYQKSMVAEEKKEISEMEKEVKEMEKKIREMKDKLKDNNK